MRSTLRDRIMKVTLAVELLKRNWAQQKFRYKIRQALLEARMKHEMQSWQKMLPYAQKLILKEEKHEIMMTFDKLKTNPDIVERNLVLFAKFIKYETIIRNTYVRIESQRIDATRRL